CNGYNSTRSSYLYIHSLGVSKSKFLVLRHLSIHLSIPRIPGFSPDQPTSLTPGRRPILNWGTIIPDRLICGCVRTHTHTHTYIQYLCVFLYTHAIHNTFLHAAYSIH
uniref:Uncharacterized protein n=1 Tax=Gopherus agassizii TaxID=38772 RepID=A0A452H4D0_9SAUR